MQNRLNLGSCPSEFSGRQALKREVRDTHFRVLMVQSLITRGSLHVMLLGPHERLAK